MVDLKAIRARTERTPGTWRPDPCGAPVVSKSYEERILDTLTIAGPLYIRRRKGVTEDEQVRKAFELLRPVLQPAYEAHQDVLQLLELVDELRVRVEELEGGRG